jgi:formylglycine-generating enzyme required for sulfatase activity/serine/threonine protein kinase
LLTGRLFRDSNGAVSLKEPTDLPISTSYSQVGPGTRLNNVYVIDQLIATGGMGQVFAGHTIETADKVAIKMIRPDLARSDTYLALFRKEAAALHRSPHDAIVRYYLFTTDPDLRCPYLAMEFVEGESLASMLGRGPLDLDTVRILQRRLAAGLDVAHRAGVIHRDVSPDNIILPGDDPNRAKIIDFGIARDPQGSATVIGGDFAGKSDFVSPEQIGLFGGEVTTKSDVYSLGLTLAAALRGAPLDMGGLPAVMVQKRSSVPDLSEIAAEMRPLLRRMLQPRPEDRPSMAEVASASTVSAPASVRPVPRKLPRWIVPAATAAAVVAVGAGVIGLLSVGDGSKSRKPEGADLSQPGLSRPMAEAAGGAATQPAETTPQPSKPPSAPSDRIAAAPPPGAPPDRATAGQLDELRLSTLSPAAPPPPARPLGTASDREGADIAPAPGTATETAAPALPAAGRPAAQAGPAPPPPLPAAASNSAAPGAFRDCDGCPELIPLPAGTLAMGSNADSSERPIHKVAIQHIAVGRFPVTEGEWRLCVAAGACSFDPGGDPDAPVHNLSWDDAEQYVGWLSRLTGRRYRMLSEAEWEYAARAGAGTRYWWGDQFKPDMSSCRSCSQAAAEPPKVGLYPPNAFGLHDVTGSVSQWVADCWHKNFKGAPTDGSAWAAAVCPERVLRGGSWTSAPADLRITNREFYDPKVRYPGHGLRIGRDL